MNRDGTNDRRTERIVIAGREIEYFRLPARRTGLPVLIFLHEGLGSASLWRHFPIVLAELTGCAAIVYSRYGNGFSTPLTGARTPAYMHEEALETLPRLLHAWRVEDVILVGQSDGASIALLYAAGRASVRALVLEAPHLFVEEMSIRSIDAIRHEYENTSLRARLSSFHADGDRTFYGWNDVWQSPEFSSWNIEPSTARVRVPILAVQGLDDEYGTLAQIETLARVSKGPVDRVLLARCGHAPHRDRAAFVESLAAQWIGERL
ncbi:MAG: alpha/beta hydrolase [Candidatus Eremiobacteraeota bacterium]|nr:alpha/beta hydrolase [Candidatus Eremiobacteraeota bacterium]MBV8374889.1 alpha/beta hydrolase [Candidatus Eremiobacteraeota bacterium]